MLWPSGVLRAARTVHVRMSIDLLLLPIAIDAVEAAAVLHGSCRGLCVYRDACLVLSGVFDSLDAAVSSGSGGTLCVSRLSGCCMLPDVIATSAAAAVSHGRLVWVRLPWWLFRWQAVRLS